MISDDARGALEQREIVLRAFEPLPEGAVCGLGPARSGLVPVRAREYRLRRAVELLRVAGANGITQAMLRDIVGDPSQSPLLDDLKAAGATASSEERGLNWAGRPQMHVVWQIDERLTEAGWGQAE